MTANVSAINGVSEMGCCDNKAKDKNQNMNKIRKVPWFGVVLGILAILVMLNWQ
ncbi:hypothetical protein M1D72_19010 [Vibrio sp. AK197]